MRRAALTAGIGLLAFLGLAGSAPALGSKSSAALLRARAIGGNPSALQRLAAPVGSCVGQDDPNAAAAVQEAAMQCLINFARRQVGLAALRESRQLDVSSANKAGDILRCNQFSHEACGRDFLFWFRRSGYVGSGCWWAGENLAWGTGGLGSARAELRAWLRSPLHRANLLGREYEQTGLALRVGGLSGAPNAHVWVNHFGRHC